MPPIDFPYNFSRYANYRPFIIFITHPLTKERVYFATWEHYGSLSVGLEVKPACNEYLVEFYAAPQIVGNVVYIEEDEIYPGAPVAHILEGHIIEENIKHNRYILVSFHSAVQIRYMICYLTDATRDDVLFKHIDKYKVGEYKHESLEYLHCYPSSERFYRNTTVIHEASFADNPNVLAKYQNIFPLKTSHSKGEIFYSSEFSGVETKYFGRNRFNEEMLEKDSHSVQLEHAQDKFVLSFRLAVLQAFTENYCSTVSLYLLKGTVLPEAAVVIILNYVFDHRVRTLPLELPVSEYLEGRLLLEDFIHYPYRFTDDGAVTQPFKNYYPVCMVSDQHPYVKSKQKNRLRHRAGCPVIPDLDSYPMVDAVTEEFYSDWAKEQFCVRFLEDHCRCISDRSDYMVAWRKEISRVSERRPPTADVGSCQRRRLE